MKSVLLVEDSPDDQFIVRRAWQRAKIKVPLLTVDDGEQAMAYLKGTGEFRDRKRNPLPTLVLLDIKLPYRDGFEVLNWIRSEVALTNLLVLMYSNSAMEGDVDRAYKLRANAYLKKPTDSSQMEEMVRQLMEFWSGYVVPPEIDEPREPRRRS